MRTKKNSITHEVKCDRCYRDKQMSSKFSAANDMNSGPMSSGLSMLSQIEKMLIARIHVYVEVRQIREQQYRYKNNVVNFHRKSDDLLSKLSLLSKDIHVILLKSLNSNEDHRLQRQFLRQHRVRRTYIAQWLHYLKRHHSGYRDVVIDEVTLSQLSDDDDVTDQLETVNIPAMGIDTSVEEVIRESQPIQMKERVSDITSHSDAEESHEVEYNAISDVASDAADVTILKEQLRSRPRSRRNAANNALLTASDIDATSISEYDGVHTLVLAFSTLYFNEAGDFNVLRLRIVEYHDYARHLMQYKNERFAQHSR
jgi:hypothetical protein